MKKINFKNSKGLNLVGVLQEPKEKTDSIVIMVHGFTSNKDRPRFLKLAEELNNNNFSTFRFDSTGSGESDEGLITIEAYVDDYKSAFNYVKTLGYSNVFVMGESIAGLNVTLGYTDEIKAIVFWCPVTAKSTPYFNNEKVKKEIEEKGFYSRFKDNKYFKIPQQYIDERENINQEELLSKIKCPVLIIHGTEDNSVSIKQSEDAIKILKTSKLLNDPIFFFAARCALAKSIT